MDGVKTTITDDVVKTVDRIIESVGKDIRFAMTLALGKPVLLINELYRRAKEDPEISLKIITALALERPAGKSELEQRFINPIAERLFGKSPQFDYMLDWRAGKLPKNVEVYEFFNKAGGYMNNPDAQRNHLNSNYTHIPDAAWDMGGNVFGQLVGCREIDGRLMLSMGCNTDICVAALDWRIKRAHERKVIAVAEVNENMPFMYGDAVYPVDAYDIVLKGPQYNYELFAPPKEPVVMRDHMIGINVSTLIKDGGTLQVGIGALGDAIVAGLDMRHSHNDMYKEVISRAGLTTSYGDLINKIGGTDTFKTGLYGSSEMFVDAFMQLYKRGILKRRVFDNIPLMKFINSGMLDPHLITPDILELLIREEGINPKLRQKDFEMLTRFGILKDGLSFSEGIIYDNDKAYPADLNDKKNLDEIRKLLGNSLKNGQVILGAFFIGPRAFYDSLNEMSEEERSQFGMSGVEKVNQLYGDEVLRALQRKDGRFVNSGMIANIFGAITSDQLEDGRVVSGIGGQYNFVAMAHALPDGRLIMMIRSTRGSGKSLRSNIVFRYGHCSVPKHLRDIIVTEYGIADIKNKPDGQVVAEMINIADSRFQPKLVAQAKKSGKLAPDYVIPEQYRNNYPEKIESFIKQYQPLGVFQNFPFGTDLTPQEIELGSSLKMLKSMKENNPLKLTVRLASEVLKPVPGKAIPYLKRMELDKPSGFNERLMRKTVIMALRSSNRI